jgi:Cys-tRNA synthase (O-phospho-L-seryl-tRNA:Cys-tRNA synthase)
MPCKKKDNTGKQLDALASALNRKARELEPHGAGPALEDWDKYAGINWVVETHDGYSVCKRCGFREKLKFPMSFDEHTRLAKKYLSEHKDCKPASIPKIEVE